MGEHNSGGGFELHLKGYGVEPAEGREKISQHKDKMLKTADSKSLFMEG